MQRSRLMIALGLWLAVGIGGAALYGAAAFLPGWAIFSLAYGYIFIAQRVIALITRTAK